MSDVTEYRSIIERFARERIDQRVPNGLPEHAAILLETMFANASAEIRIFTGELGSVYGGERLIDTAKQFLSKPYSSLRILVQKGQTPQWAGQHPLLRGLSELPVPHGKVIVQQAAGGYADGKAHHFAVMDNDGYRFELEHDTCKAIANFNEPKVAKDLMKAFDAACQLSHSKGAPILFELKAA